MLKVMKYDWKNGWHNIRLTLLLAVVVSIFAGAVLRIYDKSVPQVIFLWFAVMLALLVVTVDAVFRNMTSRMFGAQGYLTHTLPVDRWELLLGKTAGTWAFGVFMVFAAVVCWVLLIAVEGTEGLVLKLALENMLQFLPKLGDFFFQKSAINFWNVVFGVMSFLAVSFLIMMQFQFVCMIARYFGRFAIPGGILVFLIMGSIEGVWNHTEPMGFLVVLLFSAGCFAGSIRMLKRHLSV